MNENSKVLVLRYGVNIISDCIEKHMDVLTEYGYCWFGKIGRAPSTKVLSEVFNDEKGLVILYSRTGCYACNVEGFLFERPNVGYPCYYDEMIFNQGREPKFYVRITSMEKVDAAVLSEYYVCSSGNPLTTALNKSMNSFFVVDKLRERSVTCEKSVKETNDNKSKPRLDINDCQYRADGVCNRRGFVSYQFECTRPSSCAGQKR